MPERVRMKIAFVYDVVYPYVKGGVEKRVWELAVRLVRRGHEVHIFGMRYWDGGEILTREGVVMHGVCPAQPLYTGGRRSVGEAIRFGLRLIPFLARGRFDVIDCQQFPFFPCFSARIIAAVRRTRLVITWHEFWGDYWYTYLGKAGIFGKGTEWIVSRLTPYRIAVSLTTANHLRKTGLNRPLSVIPNGVDLQRVASVSRGDEESDIIFAGRLIREKNVDLLIRAFAILSAEQPWLRLRIIGNGPERESILKLIGILGLANQVRVRDFEPEHDDLLSQMKSSKICVIPSTREGFGIVALEALACGLPVVTVQHPANAIQDLITAKTGFICALSPEDLSGAMREALRRQADMRDDCIAAARAFDWDCIAKKCEKYYRSGNPD